MRSLLFEPTEDQLGKTKQNASQVQATNVPEYVSGASEWQPSAQTAIDRSPSSNAIPYKHPTLPEIHSNPGLAMQPTRKKPYGDELKA